ncbi:hypothetical protein COCNU_scaffold006534G000160 [Cocos nucifera]|nr:hypothetical protein [Cocos nucifera]
MAWVFIRYSFLDLEGKTDSKIRALEEVEELRTKRADKQSMLLLDAFNKDRASLPQPLQNPSQLSSTPAPIPPDPRTQELINEKLRKAEELGEKGMVDEAQKALEEAEALKKTDQKLRVCDICGAFLSVYDSDRRLADHFGGKLHLGYMQIREKIAELQIRSLSTGPVSIPSYYSMLGVMIDTIDTELLFQDGRYEVLRVLISGFPWWVIPALVKEFISLSSSMKTLLGRLTALGSTLVKRKGCYSVGENAMTEFGSRLIEQCRGVNISTSTNQEISKYLMVLSVLVFVPFEHIMGPTGVLSGYDKEEW